jgi:curved DNA-binding protein
MSARERFDRDYYATLGVAPEAAEDDIRHAYRKLALRWHPDRNSGDPDATERFKEISEAYAVLIDPAKRQQYDQVRQLGGPSQFGRQRDDLFRDLFADPRASAIFEELAREMERMGMRVNRRDFRETLFGGRTVVRGTVIVVSPWSAVTSLFRLGRAAVRGTRAEAAPVRAMPPRPTVLGRLAGVGRWVFGLPPESGVGLREADIVVPLRLSSKEAARGVKKRVTLAADEGREEVLVTVPAGTRAGTRLRLRGKGRAAGVGRRGDAYLTVEITDGRLPRR